MVQDIAEKVVKTCVVDSKKTTALKDLSRNEIKMFDDIIKREICDTTGNSDVTIEKAMLLRVKCEMIAGDLDLPPAKRQLKLDEFLPDTPVICSIIQNHLSLHVASVQADTDETYDDEHSFVCLQMLKMSKHADFQEETGRRMFLKLLLEMLGSQAIPDELVESCIR